MSCVQCDVGVGCRLNTGVAPSEAVQQLDRVCRSQDLPDAH